MTLINNIIWLIGAITIARWVVRQFIENKNGVKLSSILRPRGWGIYS
jgi:hypothetical protein